MRRPGSCAPNGNGLVPDRLPVIGIGPTLYNRLAGVRLANS
jgi:hypothetical protein